VADPGGVYVAPEEVGEPSVLDAGELAILRAWVDRLVPGDAHWPPASATPAVGYIDAMLDRAPAARPPIRGALARLADRGLTALGDDDRDALLRELESSEEHGPAFRAVLDMTLEAYYRDPAVEEVVEARTGFRSRLPMVGTPMAPFDEARVDRVRALPPRYRRA
jgi:hypothetical protein